LTADSYQTSQEITMTMAENLIADYRRNTWIIREQNKGLTHEQSLTQAPYNINCMNWVLGHILTSRDDVLTMVGAEPLFASQAEPYKREAEPITADGPDVVRLAELIDLVGKSQHAIAAALSDSADTLNAEVEDGESLAERIRFLLWHDTYHTGQTDLLRQISGMNDAIIS
jgi:uncharacterized damage-inducible protein DinB